MRKSKRRPKAPPRSRLRQGLVLDDWRLESFIDAGGQGEVWRVSYTKGRRLPSAVKVAFCANEKHRARFVSEFGVLSRLSHPNIVPVVTSGAAHVQLETGPAELLYYVMPFAEGTLATRDILRWGLLRLLPRYRELLTGITFVHEERVLHRDLKPSNALLLNDTGAALRTVAADFGLASDDAVPKADLTATHEMLGSHGYMAPELFTGAMPSVRTEIFALGRILQWLIAESLPYENHVSDLNGRAREALDSCVHRATAYDPQARFSSVSELADALPDLHLDLKPKRRSFPPAPQAPSCPIQPNTRIGRRSRAGNEREVFWGGGSHLSLWVAPTISPDRSWDGFELSKHATSLPWPNPDDRGHHDESRNEHGYVLFPTPAASDQRGGTDYVPSFSLVTTGGHVWCINGALCALQNATNGGTIRYLPSTAVERWFIENLQAAARFLNQALSLPAPYAWAAKLQWVSDFRLALNPRRSGSSYSGPNYTDVITRSGTFDSDVDNAAGALKPFFEQFWRAFGREREADG